MLIVFLRTLILYCVIVFGVRLMGKRQLGELQPSELVVTILISNIATLPIEEIDTPLLVGLLPILSLVVFEVLISVINLHFRPVRRIFSGTPVVVIHHGVIDQQKLRQLRYAAHQEFNKLYQSGLMTKREAYQWLAMTVQAPMAHAHIGHLGEYYCQVVIDESRKLLQERLEGQKSLGKVSGGA